MDLNRLSKIVSHALRHEPDEYNLFLDVQGWVKTEDLLHSLAVKDRLWEQIEVEDLEKMIAKSSKKRHEIKRGMIRAIYGHSVTKVNYSPIKPPPFLYHGTSPEVVEKIMIEGLRPMTRKYVHLSKDREIATLVGKRKSPTPIILSVRSLEAYKNGVKFYLGKENIYLSDKILPKYLENGNEN